MADEERNEDVTPDEQPDVTPEQQPDAEQPSDGAPAGPADQEGAAAEEPAAGGPAAGEPEAPQADEPKREAEPAEAGGAAAKDLPPGAELEPIALEPDRPMDAEERARVEAEAEERARREAEATSEDAEQPLARRAPRVDIGADQSIQATGKRKNAIARVVVRSGSGTFEVNRRPIEEYFPRPHLQTIARQALVTCGYEGSVDVAVRVHGGGVAGQAGAIRHGVARALTEIDSELRSELKRRGFLTRDARIKERRKAGLKKARKRPQFSKR